MIPLQRWRIIYLDYSQNKHIKSRPEHFTGSFVWQFLFDHFITMWACERRRHSELSDGLVLVKQGFYSACGASLMLNLEINHTLYKPNNQRTPHTSATWTPPSPHLPPNTNTPSIYLPACLSVHLCAHLPVCPSTLLFHSLNNR